MRKSDLHPSLQATCRPIPGRSDCVAVMPPPVPVHVDVPSCYGLLVLAGRELEGLGEALRKHPERSDPLLHMLNRRGQVQRP